jgi:hypothetical protein
MGVLWLTNEVRSFSRRWQFRAVYLFVSWNNQQKFEIIFGIRRPQFRSILRCDNRVIFRAAASIDRNSSAI